MNTPGGHIGRVRPAHRFGVVDVDQQQVARPEHREMLPARIQQELAPIRRDREAEMVGDTLVPVELDREAEGGGEVHPELPLLGIPHGLGLKALDCRHRSPPLAVRPGRSIRRLRSGVKATALQGCPQYSGRHTGIRKPMTSSPSGPSGGRPAGSGSAARSAARCWCRGGRTAAYCPGPPDRCASHRSNCRPR